MEQWKCYLLVTGEGTKQKTYVGVTPDLDRRLRQHNGEISGGAAATSGRQWERVCHVRGFPNHRAALQFEWRWKQISRRLGFGGDPLQRRMRALQQLLALDRPTTAAAPYSTYVVGPEVVWEAATAMPTL